MFFFVVIIVALLMAHLAVPRRMAGQTDVLDRTNKLNQVCMEGGSVHA